MAHSIFNAKGTANHVGICPVRRHQRLPEYVKVSNDCKAFAMQ